MNRTGNNTTGWARRLTALLITACLVMAMALPVYAEVDLLPDVPDEVELLEDEPGTAPEKDTIEQLPDANAPPEQNAVTPVPDAATPEPEQSAEPGAARPDRNAGAHGRTHPDPGTGSHRNGHPHADRDPHRHPGTDRTAAKDVRRKKRG